MRSVQRDRKRLKFGPANWNYVEAVGGSLTLVAQFPDKEPVAIGGLGEIALAEEKEKAKRRAAHAR
jgi:hypothetical protein